MRKRCSMPLVQPPRKEWKNLEKRRLLSTLEMPHGTIALSTLELNAICSKVRRFRDIVSAGLPRDGVCGQVPPERAPPLGSGSRLMNSLPCSRTDVLHDDDWSAGRSGAGHLARAFVELLV